LLLGFPKPIASGLRLYYATFGALDQQSLQISAPHTLTFNEHFMQKKKRMVRRAEVTIPVRYCSTPREVGRLEDL
jgi:hypothetical protein